MLTRYYQRIHSEQCLLDVTREFIPNSGYMLSDNSFQTLHT